MLTQKEFLAQLATLVSFPTLTGDVDTNARALDFVQSLVSPKAKVKRITNKNAEILLVGNRDTLAPEFGYSVHIDIVSAPAYLFTMQQKGDLVFGRGVSDMKFSIPLGIALLNELIEKKSKTTFCLAVTTDEEVGGFEGAAFLANEMGFTPKVLIVPDGGDNLRFVSKGKGVGQFTVTATGKSAHASRPWNGINALVPICRLVNALQELYGQNNERENWNTTLNFGSLQGGVSTNQVCDSATLKLDYRYPETDSVDRIEAELRSVAASIEASLFVKRMSTGLPTFTDVTLPIVQRFLSCMQKEFGHEIPTMPSFGASDARHFAQYKTPVLMIKPKGGDIHCETEYLDVSSTMKFYQALRRFVLEKK